MTGNKASCYPLLGHECLQNQHLHKRRKTKKKKKNIKRGCCHCSLWRSEQCTVSGLQTVKLYWCNLSCVNIMIVVLFVFYGLLWSRMHLQWRLPKGEHSQCCSPDLITEFSSHWPVIAKTTHPMVCYDSMVLYGYSIVVKGKFRRVTYANVSYFKHFYKTNQQHSYIGSKLQQLLIHNNTKKKKKS